MAARVRFLPIITAVAAATAAVFGLNAGAGPAYAASTNFQTPAYAGDFPDPAVIVSNQTYWAYATGSAGRNLQVMSSSNLTSWSGPTDPLPRLPVWASAGLTWAPGVIQIGGTFVMYYTVRDTALAMQCISVATSSTPGGPFTDPSTRPLICQTKHGGSIDPNPYVDPVSSRLYLLWKSDDNSIGQVTHIWAQALAPGGRSMSPGTSPTLLLTESATWQSPAVEGPTIVYHGTTYYLFYGANSFSSASSGIGYATSPALLARFTNQSRSGPWLASTGNATGPQGPMVFTDPNTSTTRMAFAAWYGPVGYQNGGARALWTGTLGFNRYGKPSLT
jgi:beta-xylosidase